LRDNGELACWGKDASGQATPPEGTHLALDVGGEFACALEFGGDPVCWGNVPDEVLPQAIISDGFSVEGVAWNFGKYDWAEAEMCLTLVDPSSVLTGGEQEILGETLIRSAGAFSVSGVETDSTLGLFMVVQDCQGVGDVVPTATGIGYAEFEGLTTGDTVMRRQTLVIDRELAGLIDSEVEGEIDLADGIEVQGAMFGFVRDTTGQFIDGATIVCDAMECPTVFYFDSDHSDGMFSTGGQLNQHADAAAESAFIIPKAPLQTYVAQLDGVQFRPEFFGSSPGSVTVIVFVGEP
jgi:hypothetical protein